MAMTQTALQTASDGIITKLLYYIDWDGASPCTSFVAKKKEEGPLQYWLSNLEDANAYPFVCISFRNWPALGTAHLKQIDMTFTGVIDIIDKAGVNENPFKLVRNAACDIVENIMYAPRLGLTYVSEVIINGVVAVSTEMQAFLYSIMKGTAAASIDFSVKGTFLQEVV